MFQRSSFNRRMIVLFSLLFSNFFLLSVAVSVNADQSTKIDETIPWEVSNQGKEPTDVTTWRREIPGADVKQFRGEVLLNHPALHVLSAINNIQDLDKWVYFCRDSYKIDDTDNVYMEYKGVWPVASRYVALQNNFEIKGGVILINSVNIKGVGPQPKNMVRIQEFNNLFEVTPLGPNTTKLRFTTFIDLSGRLPSWLANSISSRAPKDTLEGLRDRLDGEKWDFSNAKAMDLMGATPELVSLLKNTGTAY